MSWLEQINRRIPLRENMPLFRKRIVVGVIVFFCGLAWLLHYQRTSRPPEVLLNLAFDASRAALTPLDEAWSGASALQQVSSAYAGSIHQTEALARGLVADTVCLSSPGELDRLSQLGHGLVDSDWRTRFPENSSPFTSSIVFVVRDSGQGAIKDWPDLFGAKRRIAVPDPRISGAGQYAYLALAYSAEQHVGADPLKIAAALRSIHFLPHAASRSTKVFLRDKQYHALLTWESEARRLLQDPENHEFRLVYPGYSLQIEAVVAIVESQVDKRGSRQAAENYLGFYFSPEAQSIFEAAGFRPRYPVSGEPAPAPDTKLYTVEALFGSWEAAWTLHLGPTGSLTRLLAYRDARRGGTE